MRRLYLFTGLSGLFSVACFVASSVVRAVAYLFRLDARTYDGIKHALHIETASMTNMRVRTRAFVARAMGHDRFIAGHFDPGRTFA